MKANRSAAALFPSAILPSTCPTSRCQLAAAAADRRDTFGVDPAKATDKFTVRDFRADCLRELKKIKDAWPDLHYHTVTGALVLSPSPPLIVPSQLRRAEAEITDV